ncbi:glycosidase, partial [Bacteroidota bacterium]
MQVHVNRKETIFYPDPSRIIARFLFTDNNRASDTIRSVMEMSEEDASAILKQTLRDYSMRHRNISKIFENNFYKIAHLITQMEMDPDSIDNSRRMLIGSYFTMEYSIESAAFFNPSII